MKNHIQYTIMNTSSPIKISLHSPLMNYCKCDEPRKFILNWKWINQRESDEMIKWEKTFVSEMGSVRFRCTKTWTDTISDSHSKSTYSSMTLKVSRYLDSKSHVHDSRNSDSIKKTNTKDGALGLKRECTY